MTWLEQARKRCEAATKGPWKWRVADGAYLESPDGHTVLDDGSAGDEYGRTIEPDSDDGLFVAHSRTDLPFALAMLEEAARDKERDIIQCRCGGITGICQCDADKAWLSRLERGPEG